MNDEKLAEFYAFRASCGDTTKAVLDELIDEAMIMGGAVYVVRPDGTLGHLEHRRKSNKDGS